MFTSKSRLDKTEKDGQRVDKNSPPMTYCFVKLSFEDFLPTFMNGGQRHHPLTAYQKSPD